MNICYSATTNGFYPLEMKSDYELAGTWPGDAIELTEVEQATYWQQPSPEGKRLGADVDSRPVWVDLPPLSLDELTKRKSTEIDIQAQAFIDAAIPVYPEFEKLTFERQEREAKAYLVDDTVNTPTLLPIATARGLTVLEVANRVVSKADAFNALAASIAGQRQAYHDQLAAAVQAQDSATIEAIIVNYVLPA